MFAEPWLANTIIGRDSARPSLLSSLTGAVPDLVIAANQGGANVVPFNRPIAVARNVARIFKIVV